MLPKAEVGIISYTFFFATCSQIISKMCPFCLQNISCICSLLPLSTATILTQSTVLLCLGTATSLAFLPPRLPISSSPSLPTATWIILQWLLSDLLESLYWLPITFSSLGTRLKWALSWPLVSKEMALAYLNNLILCPSTPFLLPSSHSGVFSLFFFYGLCTLVFYLSSMFCPLIFPRMALLHNLVSAFASSEKSSLTTLCNHHISTALLISTCVFFFQSPHHNF